MLAADVAGYSRLMGRDEERTLAQLKTLRRGLIDPAVAAHRGRIVKTSGDGMLVEFASAVDAIRCAVELQQAVAKENAGVPPELRIEFRIGIHVGDIIIDDDDIFGDGVNIAARLEGIAAPGGICISDDAQRQIRGKLDVVFDDMGPQELKNIAEPMRSWCLRFGDQGSASPSPSSLPSRVHQLALPDKPSIVVLPFDNMSAEPGQDFLADGIVEAITSALSRIRSFFVIARTSAFTYKGRARDAREIGRELGVAYLLEGSVQKFGNRLRIIVQLIETEAGAHVWSSRFDGTMDEFFEFEDRITEQVAGALQPSVRIAEIERSRRKRPQDLGSYDYTMRAMPHVWALEKEESAKAIELLETALTIDPNYPLALSLAGWCHAQRSVYNWAEDIAESQRKAQSLAEQAAQMSGDDPIILAVLGAVHTFVRNHGTARILLERAVTLDPNAAWAWSRLGWVENYADQPKKAIEHFQRALRLSPIDPINFNNYVGIGSAHEISQEYDEAAALYRRGLQERPNARWIYRNLAACLSGAGRMEEAQQAYAELMRSYPDLTIPKFKQAMVFSPSALERMAENLRKLGLPE
ncbi:MAG TPA: adenylate/guanylate cyclase domain-containing protein [Bradyrhizobium sp.]|uniref:adenylate/guanylate cyclase domain-containing protein n=1 Tax=Bradyrhizobium sp. TaxID=376 RepID=UPI002B498C58|nr:adenylate/guanylate cyclase domain-containing protein [Bradyrhizobium sp.]HKO70166.1 adenylate/guanylate cyclase domain-containing protein [Bradyrhizobium sp.]